MYKRTLRIVIMVLSGWMLLLENLITTLKFFVEKMREAIALQKLLSFFQQKILANFRY